jgi:D-sedoheptulose 7-phosphate isomerase
VSPKVEYVSAARELLESSAQAIRACFDLLDEVTSCAERIAESLAAGGKVLICGNGGSAADAQHFAGELLGRFVSSERTPLAAIALPADSAVITCVANDYEFAEVFARQVKALARPGDVLVGISTSGGSASVVRAFEAAPAGVTKIALTGRGGALADVADIAIRVPAEATAPIQAAHITVIHAICAVLEERFRQH